MIEYYNNNVDDIISPILIAGIDEAGRGPLAGPVVAAAVILDPARPIVGLADSKQLSAAKRKTLSANIKSTAQAWHVAEASVDEIDTLNILQATLLAMRRAIMGLDCTPALALIDGNRVPTDLPCPARALIKGDTREPCISAASILAKTHRDALMCEWDKIYPAYGFAQHMGYGTKRHLAALAKYGPIPIHRQSFAPVRRSRRTS